MPTTSIPNSSPFAASGTMNILASNSVKKDYLGQGIHYRDTQTIEVEGIFYDHSTGDGLPDGNVNAFICVRIAELYNNTKFDIRVTNLVVNTSPDAFEGLKLIQKFSATVELRINLDTATVNNQGLDTRSSFFRDDVLKDILSKARMIDSISEDFNFTEDSSGTRGYDHSVNLTLRKAGGTANKNETYSGAGLILTAGFTNNNQETYADTVAEAKWISSLLFDNEYQHTNFPHYAFNSALSYYADDAMYGKPFFSETFDQQKGTFSFRKSVRALSKETLLSRYGKYTPKISVQLSEAGEFSVTFSALFRETNNGFAGLILDVNFFLQNEARSECASFFNSCVLDIYRPTDPVPPIHPKFIIDDLSLLPSEVRKVVSITAGTIDVSVTYKSTGRNTIPGYLVEETFEIVTDTNRNDSIDHKYKITARTKYLSVQERLNLSTLICLKYAQSFTTTNNYASSFAIHDKGVGFLLRPTKSSISQKMKDFEFSVSYSNDPILSSDPANYKKIAVNVKDSFPMPVINEHVIIGRAAGSVINNEFATKSGTRTITIIANRNRPVSSYFTLGGQTRMPASFLTMVNAKVNVLAVDVLNALRVKYAGGILELRVYLKKATFKYSSSSVLEAEIVLNYTFKRPDNARF